MLRNIINKKLLCILIFIISIFTFALIYKIILNNTVPYDTCLYVSTTMQTFTGNTLIEKNRIAKNVATIQCIITYVLLVYIICI